jgi:hypothetical protein
MGPPLAIGLALVALPVLVYPRRRHAGRQAPGDAAADHGGLPSTALEDLPRQALADAFGLSEPALFRARHARCTTVHHDPQGAIVGLDVLVAGVSTAVVDVPLQRQCHAHPVG